MIELKLADLKETFDYIKTTHIKELLNPFSVVVSYKNESYILRKLESEYKFFLEVSFIKEDNINYYYKIKCYDEKVGPRIEDEYSIRKKTTAAPNTDEIIKEAFYRVYRSLSKIND